MMTSVLLFHPEGVQVEERHNLLVVLQLPVPKAKTQTSLPGVLHALSKLTGGSPYQGRLSASPVGRVQLTHNGERE